MKLLKLAPDAHWGTEADMTYRPVGCLYARPTGVVIWVEAAMIDFNSDCCESGVSITFVVTAVIYILLVDR